MNSEVVVVGGGVIGLLCARACALQGAETTLVERAVVGGESSWAGAGILSPLDPARYPQDVLRLWRRSDELYPALVDGLAEAGGQVEYERSGLIRIVGKNGETVPKEQVFAANDRDEYLASAALAAAEPALSLGRTGCRFPRVAQLRNPRFIGALREDLASRGVRICEQTAVEGFSIAEGRFEGLVLAGGRCLSTPLCVVAAGAWTRNLLLPTGLDLPIHPIRGQILLYAGPPGLVRHILVTDEIYLVPRRDGRILVGSTVEDVGFDKSTTDAARDFLHRAAVELVPALANVPIERQWAGLRPGSPTGVPVIGRHPDVPGLYVCAGHYRNGFATAPASAELLTDLMFGRIPHLEPGPYGLSGYRAASAPSVRH